MDIRRKLSAPPSVQLATETSHTRARQFLNKVQRYLYYKKNMYTRFINLIQSINTDRFPIFPTIKEVMLLFSGHPQLLNDLNQFLPRDVEFIVTEVDDDTYYTRLRYKRKYTERYTFGYSLTPPITKEYLEKLKLRSEQGKPEAERSSKTDSSPELDLSPTSELYVETDEEIRSKLNLKDVAESIQEMTTRKRSGTMPETRPDLEIIIDEPSSAGQNQPEKASSAQLSDQVEEEAANLLHKWAQSRENYVHKLLKPRVRSTSSPAGAGPAQPERADTRDLPSTSKELIVPNPSKYVELNVPVPFVAGSGILKRKRGRPRKSETGPGTQKGKRGRPRKNIPIVSQVALPECTDVNMSASNSKGSDTYTEAGPAQPKRADTRDLPSTSKELSVPKVELGGSLPSFQAAFERTISKYAEIDVSASNSKGSDTYTEAGPAQHERADTRDYPSTGKELSVPKVKLGGSLPSFQAAFERAISDYTGIDVSALNSKGPDESESSLKNLAAAPVRAQQENLATHDLPSTNKDTQKMKSIYSVPVSLKLTQSELAALDVLTYGNRKPTVQGFHRNLPAVLGPTSYKEQDNQTVTPTYTHKGLPAMVKPRSIFAEMKPLSKALETSITEKFLKSVKNLPPTQETLEENTPTSSSDLSIHVLTPDQTDPDLTLVKQKLIHEANFLSQAQVSEGPKPDQNGKITEETTDMQPTSTTSGENEGAASDIGISSETDSDSINIPVMSSEDEESTGSTKRYKHLP